MFTLYHFVLFSHFLHSLNWKIVNFLSTTHNSIASAKRVHCEHEWMNNLRTVIKFKYFNGNQCIRVSRGGWDDKKIYDIFISHFAPKWHIQFGTFSISFLKNEFLISNSQLRRQTENNFQLNSSLVGKEWSNSKMSKAHFVRFQEFCFFFRLSLENRKSFTVISVGN